MFLTVRGVKRIDPSYSLPTCKGFFNIFHPVRGIGSHGTSAHTLASEWRRDNRPTRGGQRLVGTPGTPSPESLVAVSTVDGSRAAKAAPGP